MKILIINELIVEAGTEIQTIREQSCFKNMGHDVYRLTFDSKFPQKLIGDEINYPLVFNKLDKAYNRLFCDSRHLEELSNIIDNIHPDVIHVNNIVNLPIVVLKSVANYPCIQTIRDYGAVCPKATCIHEDGKICKGYKHDNCFKCTNHSFKYLYTLLSIKRINKLRKKNINYFVSPSLALSKTCTTNEIETKCLNNPFDMSILKTSDNISNKKVYFYYGKISEVKGVTILVNTFKRFQVEHPEVELWIAGKIESSYKQEFDYLIKNENIRYLGVLTNTSIMEIYPDVYCVVVPSLWIENYPNTVLEALANKTMVIGTDRGGIPELIGNKDQLFDILNEETIKTCFEYVYNLSSEAYLEIVTKRFNYVRDNNSIKRYYDRLMSIYEELLVKFTR